MSIPFAASPDIFAEVGRMLDTLAHRLADTIALTGDDLAAIDMPAGWAATSAAQHTFGTATGVLTSIHASLAATVTAMYDVAAGYDDADRRGSARQERVGW